MTPASFLGQSASRPRTVKEPPKSGQSASTKQRNPRTGMLGFSPSASADEFDLLGNTVDQCGAVPAPDQQLLHPGPEHAALDLELRATPVALGVDHEDAARADHKVVDVRASSGNATVMEDDHRRAGQFVEPSSQFFLAHGAGRPRPGAWRVVAERQDETSEFRVLSRMRSSRLAFRRSNSRLADAPAAPEAGVASTTGALAAAAVATGMSWRGRFRAGTRHSERSSRFGGRPLRFVRPVRCHRRRSFRRTAISSASRWPRSAPHRSPAREYARGVRSVASRRNSLGGCLFAPGIQRPAPFRQCPTAVPSADTVRVELLRHARHIASSNVIALLRRQPRPAPPTSACLRSAGSARARRPHSTRSTGSSGGCG